MKPRIAITLGDPSGIGPEIVAKALRAPAVRRACELIVIGDMASFGLHHERPPACDSIALSSAAQKITIGRPSKAAGLIAVESLRRAIGLWRTGQIDAVVTAPVSKESFHFAGLGFPGHTEWLAHECGAKNPAMLMASGPMRALLMTRHLPLRRVASALNAGVIENSAHAAAAFCREVLRIARPSLVLCGVNPHAGDNGMIGKEEVRVFRPALARLRRKPFDVHGPMAADAAFRDMARGRYDVALAAYHDQGMIALKVYGSERLINITLGLPFVRTSPGHGTAYDIAGKKTADPRPMIEAIGFAARYACARARA